MKSIVVHIREDVCAQNGRDPEAVKLIEVARTFGTVETLDSAMAAERSKQQTVFNNLTAQYEADLAEKEAKIKAIEEFNVTPEELEVLRAIRAKSASEAVQYKKEIHTRDEQLRAIQVENENRAAAIKAMYGF